jgi:hypothetical protein
MGSINCKSIHGKASYYHMINIYNLQMLQCNINRKLRKRANYCINIVI